MDADIIIHVLLLFLLRQERYVLQLTNQGELVRIFCFQFFQLLLCQVCSVRICQSFSWFSKELGDSLFVRCGFRADKVFRLLQDLVGILRDFYQTFRLPILSDFGVTPFPFLSE